MPTPPFDQEGISDEDMALFADVLRRLEEIDKTVGEHG